MLTGTEGDDAPNWIVWGHANGDAITGNNLDTKAAHAAAQLGEYFMAGVALHAIEAAAVHSDDGTLHVDQIILAQTISLSFLRGAPCSCCLTAPQARGCGPAAAKVCPFCHTLASFDKTIVGPRSLALNPDRPPE